MSSPFGLTNSLPGVPSSTPTKAPVSTANTRPGTDANMGGTFSAQDQWSQEAYDRMNLAKRAEYDQAKLMAQNPLANSLERTAAEMKVREYENAYAAWAKNTQTQHYATLQAIQNAEKSIAAGVQRGVDISAEKAIAAKQAELFNRQKEQIGTKYADDLAMILAGRNNFANTVNQQQDVTQQAALAGWTGAAGALAGQQKAAQLGVTDILQDRAAAAQDIFATNNAIVQRTQAALDNEFAINEQDFNRQLGYNQQILADANQALQYATGQQKYVLQQALNDYNNKLAEYRNSMASDRLNDEKGWSAAKAVVGAVVAVASAVAAIPTHGATLPGIAAGAKFATS